MMWSRPNRWGWFPALALFGALLVSLNGCARNATAAKPSIEFTVIPLAGAGGPEKEVPIAGQAVGFRPGQRIVLFAKAGKWWVQPTVDQPFTTIGPDSRWANSTHLGTDYAALLVEEGYRPPPTLDDLPTEGGDVVALRVVPGTNKEKVGPRTIQFSGYEWEARASDSNRGGWSNDYNPENAWTDQNGFLHLRIAKSAGQWTCAEVKLSRSLGYGSYIFVVRDVAQLEPVAALSMFTWDDDEAGQNHREMNIELARWGDPANKNAQFVVQPYYVPANVFRFNAPAGELTHSLRWESGRAGFRTVRGSVGNGSNLVAEQTFTSGIPSPGGESIHLAFYIFGNAKDPFQNDVEVVIEKFEYLP